LEEVLRTVNPVLRGWARLIHWIRYKHPHLTWKQLRRRFYGADRITEGGLVLYNPAKMRVERYRFRGAQISTPYNIDEVDPDGARFRRTSHDDAAFVGQVSEYLA
jgi:RNA-directed DNA polymerase